MRIVCLLLVVGAFASLPAAALEVGPLQMQRPAGQPAYAEIALSDSSPIDPASVRARVATPEGYRVAGMRYVPALRSLSMTPQAAPNGRVVLRIDGFPSGSEVGELDLLLLVGDRVSLSLNEYRVDLRSGAREFAAAPAGTRLASKTPSNPPTVLASAAPPSPSRPPPDERAVAASPPPPSASSAAATASALDAATSAQVAQALSGWVKAWSDRNVDGYLGAYVANYEPPNRRMSHAEWEKQRRSRIAAKQLIEVALSDVQMRRRGDTVVATFQQRYRGDSLVESSRKRVVFAREQDRWLIQEEVELR